MISNQVKTKATYIRSILNKKQIHFMNLPKGATIQYDIELVNSGRIKLDNIFGIHKPYTVKEELQSLIIYWGDGDVTQVYEEKIKTGDMEDGIVLDHMYDLPMGTSITLTIVSDSETYIPVSFFNDIDSIKIKKIYGTINAIDEIAPFHDTIKSHLEEILSIKEITGESLFSRVNPNITSLENLFSGFKKLKVIHFDTFTHDRFMGVENVSGMFKDTGDITLPNTIFDFMPNIIKADSLFEGSKINKIYYDIFEKQTKLQSVSRVIKNCKELESLPDKFLRHDSIKNFEESFYGVNIKNLFDNVLKDRVFDGCKVSGMFAENPNLVIPLDIMSKFSNTVDYSRIFNNSSIGDFDTLYFENVVSVQNGNKMFNSDTLLDNSEEILEDEKIRLVTSSLGSIVDVENLLANRNIEIKRKPFIFTQGITEVKYNDCFLGSKSIYSDRQIFGDFYNSEFNSGLDQIFARCEYTVKTNESSTSISLLSAYNNITEFPPSLDSNMLIEWGDGSQSELLYNDFISLNATNGIIAHEYNGAGTYNIVVTYAHCAVVTPIEFNENDNYTIEKATIELFPTDVSYIGVHGTELFHAKNVSGDFFKLFRYHSSYFPLEANTWVSGIFRMFNNTVETIETDIFKSSYCLGDVTELKYLFRYNVSEIEDRSVKFSSNIPTINPFNAVNGEHIKFFNKVEVIERWFNDPIDDNLIDIGSSNILNLVSNFSNLKTVNMFLHACEFRQGLETYINWSLNSNLETIISYIGRTDSLDLILLSHYKLRKINKLHLYPMHTGLDKTFFNGFVMDFEQLDGEVDITDMFLNENFEIPNGFISNVSGNLLYNNCFKGSYRLDEDEDLVFSNVLNRENGHQTGLVSIALNEPLKVHLEYNQRPTTISLDFELRGKDPTPGTQFPVILRLYKTLTTYLEDSETEEHEVIYVSKTLRHIVSNNFEDILKLNTIESIFSDSDEIHDLFVEIYCSNAIVAINKVEGTAIDSMSGVFGYRYWRESDSLSNIYLGLKPSKIICTEHGGPFKNILPIQNEVNFTHLFGNTTDTDLIDYRVLKTQAGNGDVLNLTECFVNSSLGDFDVRMFEFVGDVSIDGTSLFQSNSNPLFRFINLESGPYIFMELLFTKFTRAHNMFRWAATPNNIFNGARYWGCDRNGNITMVSNQKLTNLKSFISLYQDENNHPNNLMNDYWPEWNKNQTYILEDISIMCNGRRIKVNPEYDYGYLPNTVDKLYANSAFRPTMNGQKLTLDILKLNNSYNVNYVFTTYDSPNISLLKDMHWIESDLSTGVIQAWSMFNSGKSSLGDSDFKFLIEPFNYSLNQIDFRETFKYFTTYAPDEVLFRNINYTGDSGATKLDYPNFVEYKNITLTGTTLTLTREELLPEHSFTTYITMSIDYGSGYDEPIWAIIDKGSDTIDLELTPERIVNNNVSIKIQSTHCFYLVKSNIDRVQLLTGSYRKDLQPGDSEFFNFKAEYMWFVEEFGRDLFKDVKIKQDIDNFRFVVKDSQDTHLKIIHGDIFRTQKHLTDISNLFLNCIHYKPEQNVLNGMSNVTKANSIFQNTDITDTSLILSNLTNLEFIDNGFKYSKNLRTVHPDTFKYNTKIKSLNGTYSEIILNEEPIPREFFNNISSTCIFMKDMFMNTVGLSLDKGTGIEDNSFNLSNPLLVTDGMFSGTDLRDVKISFINIGSITSSSSVNMFLGCSTYEDRDVFESRYGNNTGVEFINSISYGFESVEIMDGLLDLIDDGVVDTTERFKLVLDNSTWYRTIQWAIENINIGLGTNFEIYSNRTLIPRSGNVTKLKGTFPSKKVVNDETSQLGNKYPLIESISPALFTNLTEQTDMEGFFKNLRDINTFPVTLLNNCVKLENVQYIFSNAGGHLSSYNSKVFDNKPKLKYLNNAYENVSVGMITEGSIKIKSSDNTTLILCHMFSNSNAYISKNIFDVENEIVHIDRMFEGCKTIFEPSEVINIQSILTENKASLCGIETVNSFKPRINITDTLVNVFPLYSNVETGKKVDILVDWGDNTDQIYRNVNAESIGTITKLYGSTGTITPRIWCNYYGVGIKNNHEVNSSITEHAGGCFGENICTNSQLRLLFKTYFPECTSIEDTLFNYVKDRNFVYVFKDSKITSTPGRIFKSNRADLTPIYLSASFDTTSVRTFNSETFKDISMPSNQNDLDFSFLFGGSQNISEIHSNLFSDLVDRSIKITNISNMFRNTIVENKVVPAELLMDVDFTNLHGVIDRVFQGCNLRTFNKQIFRNIDEKLISLDGIFLNAEELEVTEDFIIDKSWLAPSGTVVLSNAFKRVTPQRIDYRIVEKKEDITLNVLEALSGVRSIYTEEEIFDYNKTINSSGLVSDSRISQVITVTAGVINLQPLVNNIYDKPVLIKINGLVHTKLDTPINLTLNVNDEDVIEIITFDNITDVFYSVDTRTSTSKVKKLDGILNIGEGSCSDGVFNFTLLELFGPSVEEISNTFFTNFKIVTGVPNLCKGLVKLRAIAPNMLDHFVLVNDWTSMFENCDSLVLNEHNSNMFRVANQGITFDYMFKNNISIVTIPPQFFKGCVQFNKSFTGTFMNCYNITAIPNDIDDF
ncbi:MAG: hypothetical protein ACRCX2_14680 [Paraclostridium sp.]